MTTTFLSTPTPLYLRAHTQSRFKTGHRKVHRVSCCWTTSFTRECSSILDEIISSQCICLNSTGQADSTSSSSQSTSLSPSSSITPPPSASTASSRTEIIVAAVVPSVVAVLIAAVAIFFFCTRRRGTQGHYDPPEDELVKGPGIGGWEQNSISPFAFPASASATGLTTSGALDTSSAGASSSASDLQVGWSPASRNTLNPSVLAYSESNQYHPPFLTPSYSGAPAPTSSQHSDAIHVPIAPTSEPESYHDSERRFISTPPTKAEEAGMFLLSPAGLRPLPARPTPGTQSGVQRSHTLSSAAPPAYDNASRYDP